MLGGLIQDELKLRRLALVLSDHEEAAGALTPSPEATAMAANISAFRVAEGAKKARQVPSLHLLPPVEGIVIILGREGADNVLEAGPIAHGDLSVDLLLGQRDRLEEGTPEGAGGGSASPASVSPPRGAALPKRERPGGPAHVSTCPPSCAVIRRLRTPPNQPARPGSLQGCAPQGQRHLWMASPCPAPG